MQMRAGERAHHRIYISLLTRRRPRYPFHSHIIRLFASLAPFSDGGDGRAVGQTILSLLLTALTALHPLAVPVPPILSCFIRFCRIVLPSFDCVSSCAGLLPRRRTLSECVIRRQKMLDSRTYFSTSGFPFGPFPISLPSFCERPFVNHRR